MKNIPTYTTVATYPPVNIQDILCNNIQNIRYNIQEVISEAR